MSRRRGSTRPHGARRHISAVLCLFGGLTACDGSPTMPVDVPTPRAQPVMERFLSAENTTTTSGVWVPLAVRVLDLHTRLPMADLPVRWKSATAPAEFTTSPWFAPSDSLMIVTNQAGIAHVYARYRDIGTTEISASLGGSDTGKVTFTITVPTPAPYVISFGPLFDCNEPSTFAFAGGSATNLSVPVGGVVEWVYADWLHFSCTARIESTSVPTGATGFNSGLMYPGQRFRVVFDAAGTWTYTDAVNGGSGTIIVTPR